MAQWHLEELRKALEKSGWRLTQNLPGDDNRIAGRWRLERAGTAGSLIIDFDGHTDKGALPLVEAYGANVQGTNISLYFGRRGEAKTRVRRLWAENLRAFVDAASASAEH